MLVALLHKIARITITKLCNARVFIYYMYIG